MAIPLLANAQNLITNGTFDANIAGWETFGIWDGTRDANNNPHSGSNQIVAPHQSNNSGLASSQCVPVTAGRNYTLSAQILIPSALTTTSGNASVMVFWTSNPTCNTSNITGRAATNSIDNSSTLDLWHGVGASLTAPPGTQGALIDLYSNAFVAGGQFTANFDDVVFAAQPAASAVAAPAMGSGALALGALLLLAAVATRLRRISQQ